MVLRRHQDPAANISIMVSAAQKIRSIRFCSVFARCCQRFRPHAHAAPPDPASEIVNRVTIAERLAQTS
jgi:hypothetical protein